MCVCLHDAIGNLLCHMVSRLRLGVCACLSGDGGSVYADCLCVAHAFAICVCRRSSSLVLVIASSALLVGVDARTFAFATRIK